jgi:hypothetical protein
VRKFPCFGVYLEYLLEAKKDLEHNSSRKILEKKTKKGFRWKGRSNGPWHPLNTSTTNPQSTIQTGFFPLTCSLPVQYRTAVLCAEICKLQQLCTLTFVTAFDQRRQIHNDGSECAAQKTISLCNTGLGDPFITVNNVDISDCVVITGPTHLQQRSARHSHCKRRCDAPVQLSIFHFLVTFIVGRIIVSLTCHHLQSCPSPRRIWPTSPTALPFAIASHYDMTIFLNQRPTQLIRAARCTFISSSRST